MDHQASPSPSASAPSNAPPDTRDAPARPASILSRELAGDLPCVQCGYNLKGLTVRGMCPECGVSVRTTLLAVVDPRAREFRHVEHPRAVAWGLMLWSGAACAACIVVWLLQLAYVFRPEARFAWDAVRFGESALLALGVLSGLGALALIRPHGGLSPRTIASAVMGVLAYVPLLWAADQLYRRMGAGLGSAFSSAAMEVRAPYRLVASAAGLVLLVGLRPHARALQARWLLMRIGAVTRQTMLAMVIVILVWVVADALVLLSGRFHGGNGDVVRLIARLLILFGAIFLTVGTFSIALDCWRIRTVLLRPPRALDQLLARAARTDPAQSAANSQAAEMLRHPSPTTQSALAGGRPSP